MTIFNYGLLAPLAERPIQQAGEHAEAHLLAFDTLTVIPGFDAWASLEEEKNMAKMIAYNHGENWQNQ